VSEVGKSLLTDAIRAFVGAESETVVACEPVEPGAVRRFAQAIMEQDPLYDAAGGEAAYGGPVAPPLFPQTMFATPFGTPDALSERAGDPAFDGLVPVIGTGLPELPLPGLGLLNGGAEVEFYRHARHGERVKQRSRYADIYEQVSAKGPMLFVITLTEYRTAAGELLLRIRQTEIRR